MFLNNQFQISVGNSVYAFLLKNLNSLLSCYKLLLSGYLSSLKFTSKFLKDPKPFIQSHRKILKNTKKIKINKRIELVMMQAMEQGGLWIALG